MWSCDVGLLRLTHPTSTVGDILKIRAHDVGLGDMALVEMPDGAQSPAQAMQLDGDEVSLQVSGGGEGLSTQATVRLDGGPSLSGDRRVYSGGPSVNPVTPVRVVWSRSGMRVGLPTYVGWHGETAWTRSGQHTELTNLPLKERGECNARRLGERPLTFARAFTSPLRRAFRTCEPRRLRRGDRAL
jgi:Histidine phosphatase superfamily (branch 1)